jgi:hypothetical protein
LAAHVQHRCFAKEMMPMTCLAYLSDDQGKFINQNLAKKAVEAFKKSLVSGEIKNACLETALQIYPFE